LVAPLQGRGLKHVLHEDIKEMPVVAPLQGRGLKRAIGIDNGTWFGRPFAGAWIETLEVLTIDKKTIRRPFAGAWIETVIAVVPFYLISVAPLQGRGLKPQTARNYLNANSRPFAGAWIETIYSWE